MKKGLFSVMNYLLPQKGIASMHCSANRGEAGDVALFFGLSGTGKTTLSTDPHRQLIGDDEHGWDDDGVFNFEGGAATLRPSISIPQAEPEIYGAIRRNALLENVVVRADGSVDYADGSKTENTRVSHPLSHIDNIVKPVSRAGHPSKVIFPCRRCVWRPAAGLPSDHRADAVPFPVGFHLEAGGHPSVALPSRRRPSPPAMARRSCCFTRPSTPAYWRRRWRNPVPKPGWSTPAGTARANACAAARYPQHH